jgi:Fe-Mn family superoxide dismutase
MINRRQAIQRTALLGAGAMMTAPLVVAPFQAAEAATPFSLPPLAYAFDALEPHIDAQTMQIHHDKHHAAYVTNLNKAIAQTPALSGLSIEALLKDLNALPESVRAAVRNHGGGHANHSLFWQQLGKNNGRGPSAELASALEKRFGSIPKFKESFSDAATKQFGSGWAWLTIDAKKELLVESTANQDSPLSAGRTPLLGIDVWEHAYYLKYQNRRADYIAAFYNVINWDSVTERYRNVVRG